MLDVQMSMLEQQSMAAPKNTTALQKYQKKMESNNPKEIQGDTTEYNRKIIGSINKKFHKDTEIIKESKF